MSNTCPNHFIHFLKLVSSYKIYLAIYALTIRCNVFTSNLHSSKISIINDKLDNLILNASIIELVSFATSSRNIGFVLCGINVSNLKVNS